jgi:hypothetical protein
MFTCYLTIHQTIYFYLLQKYLQALSFGHSCESSLCKLVPAGCRSSHVLAAHVLCFAFSGVDACLPSLPAACRSTADQAPSEVKLLMQLGVAGRWRMGLGVGGYVFKGPGLSCLFSRCPSAVVLVGILVLILQVFVWSTKDVQGAAPHALQLA